jgi:hypothetical protein
MMTGECKPLHSARGGGAVKNVKVYSVSIVNARELGVTGWLSAVSSMATVADQDSGPTGRHIVPVSGTSAGYV